MTWLYLSILAAFIWAVVNIVAKIIVSRLVSSSSLLVVASGIAGAVVGSILIFLGNAIPTPFHIGVALGSGILYLGVGSLLFFRALSYEEVSRVVPIFALDHVWVPIIAALLLQEVFGITLYAGVACITIGSFLILWRPARGVPYAFKPLALMVGSTLGYSSSLVLMKYLLGWYSFWTVAGYMMLGQVLVAAILAVVNHAELRRVSRRVWLIMVGDEGLNLVALFIFTIAASRGFITFVDSVGASQYLFIFLLGLILSHWFPRILKEDLTPRLVFLKLFSTLLIVVGVVVIALKSSILQNFV